MKDGKLTKEDIAKEITLKGGQKHQLSDWAREEIAKIFNNPMRPHDSEEPGR